MVEGVALTELPQPMKRTQLQQGHACTHPDHTTHHHTTQTTPHHTTFNHVHVVALLTYVASCEVCKRVHVWLRRGCNAPAVWRRSWWPPLWDPSRSAWRRGGRRPHDACLQMGGGNTTHRDMAIPCVCVARVPRPSCSLLTCVVVAVFSSAAALLDASAFLACSMPWHGPMNEPKNTIRTMNEWVSCAPPSVSSVCLSHLFLEFVLESFPLCRRECLLLCLGGLARLAGTRLALIHRQTDGRMGDKRANRRI